MRGLGEFLCRNGLILGLPYANEVALGPAGKERRGVGGGCYPNATEEILVRTAHPKGRTPGSSALLHWRYTRHRVRGKGLSRDRASTTPRRRRSSASHRLYA